MDFGWTVKTVKTPEELEITLNALEYDMYRIFYISPIDGGFMVVGKVEK